MNLIVNEREEHSQHIAAEATRRAWSYSQRGTGLRLDKRWQWHVRYDHPFQWKGHGRGLDRSVSICDVLAGASPKGRAFWSFWYPITAGAWGLHGRFVTRSVAFVYTSATLPTVSVAARQRIDTAPITAAIQDMTASRLRVSPGGETDRAGRLYGWAVGGDEFQRRYRVKADSRQAAGWLARPATQAALLESKPAISLTSNGADILAWTDHGGSHVSRVEDYDIPTVEAMLAILDAVDLTDPVSIGP